MRAVVALLLVAGCGALPQLLPGPDDGGNAKVPGTYHDARLSEGHLAHLSLSGEKQMACRDCHLIADAGFRADAVKPCSTCHEKQQEHHHPFDGGVALTCFTCHVFRFPTGDRWGCAGCHVKPREGVPHVTVHVEKCSACHRPHGVPFTKAADCGQCHDVIVSHGKGEQALPADTCMSCHPHHTKAVVALGQCATCHIGGNVPARAQVKPGALFSPGHLGCSSCHKPHAFTKTAVKNCVSCHEQKPVIGAEKHVACITCHRPHDDRAAPRACQSCHKEQASQVKHPADVAGHPCIGCHPPHAVTARAAVAVACVTCHVDKPSHAAKIGCRQCHVDAHAGKPERAALCPKCHEAQTTLTKKNKGHQDCAKCHEGLPHGPVEAPKPCLTCHESKVPVQKGHQEKLSCASCHQSHSAVVTTKCTDCHNKPDAPLPGLHQVLKHQKCASCHAPHTPQPGGGPTSPAVCRTCHVQLQTKAHPVPPQQCVGCHLFSEPR